MFAVSRRARAWMAVAGIALTIAGCSGGGSDQGMDTQPTTTQLQPEDDVCDKVAGIQTTVPAGYVVVDYPRTSGDTLAEDRLDVECIADTEFDRRKAEEAKQRKAANKKFSNYVRQLTPLRPGLPQMRVAVDYFCKSGNEHDAYYNAFPTKSYYTAGWGFVDNSWPKEFDSKIEKVCESTAGLAWSYSGVETHTHVDKAFNPK